MNSARWQQIQSLFAAALERPVSERDAFLRETCTGDDDLYREVTSLLKADADAHSILNGSAVDAVGIPRDLSLQGNRVGAYRIVKQIGAGGMGAVYLAERADRQFEQKVALKLIKRGMDSDEILRRFRSERQILARLQHPNIARLLDGGMTDDGLPYFTMEYVDGEPIDSYCDRLNLTIDERLHLFQTVCSTVQYAHTNLVIHRDLKPSNIMVTEDGTVKLLDFGISKVLSSPEEAAEATGLTRLGLKIMTPEYASPEQVRGEPVTTGSDVYSLGVILYELLTGHRPYTFPSRSPIEIENVIRTTEPKKPSTVIQHTERREDGAAATTPELVSRTRSTLPEKLRKKLSGDIDNICLKTLMKEPEQRYSSADHLLRDIVAHVKGQPVSARPATVSYRVQKFVKRHMPGVLTAATVFLVVAGLVTFYTIRLAEERDLAQVEARKAAQVSEFLSGIFKVSDPSESRGETITARELLERGAKRIETELADQPRVQATMMAVVGNVYRSLGLYETAEIHLGKSLEIRRRVLGGSHPDVAASLNDLGNLVRARGIYRRADSLLREALSIRQDLSGQDDLAVAESLNDLGMVLRDMGALDEAEPLLTRALTIRQKLLGDEHERIADGLNNLALMNQDRGNYRTADSLMRTALAMRERLLGEHHPDIPLSMSSLAFILQDRGHYDQAESLFRKALELDRRILGDIHPTISTDLYQLASLIQLKGQYDSAEVIFRQVLELDKRLLGPEHPYIALDINNIASVRSDRGDLKGAEILYREALALNQKARGQEHPEVATSLSNLGVNLNKQGRHGEAEPFLREALTMRRKLLGEKHPHVLTSLNILASLMHNKGDSREAMKLYREVLDMRKELLGSRHPQTANTQISLGGLLLKTAPAQAETLLRGGLDVLQEKLPPGHWEIASAKSQLGSCLAALGRYVEAESLLWQGYERLKKVRGERDRFTIEGLRSLVKYYEAAGATRQAAELRTVLEQSE